MIIIIERERYEGEDRRDVGEKGVESEGARKEEGLESLLLSLTNQLRMQQLQCCKCSVQYSHSLAGGGTDVALSLSSAIFLEGGYSCICCSSVGICT